MIVHVLLVLLGHVLPSVHAATTRPLQAHGSDGLSLVDVSGTGPASNGSTVDEIIYESFCTKDPLWNRPTMNIADCEGVLEYFYYETMAAGFKEMRQFLKPGAQRSDRHLAVQMTPRKYIYSTCTLAIVLLDDFPNPERLPSQYKTGPPVDFSTYKNLNKVAEDLVKKCARWSWEAGYRVTGRQNGIGVFIWATDSDLDKEIVADEPGLTFISPKSGKAGSTATS